MLDGNADFDCLSLRRSRTSVATQKTQQPTPRPSNKTNHVVFTFTILSALGASPPRGLGRLGIDIASGP